MIKYVFLTEGLSHLLSKGLIDLGKYTYTVLTEIPNAGIPLSTNTSVIICNSYQNRKQPKKKKMLFYKDQITRLLFQGTDTYVVLRSNKGPIFPLQLKAQTYF